MGCVNGKGRTMWRSIDTFSDKIARVVSLLSLVLMVIIVIAVVARYVFHAPFIWGPPVNKQVFGVFILFGGVYAMLTDAHLRVEVLYNRFSRRMKSYADLVDLIALLVFMGILIWQAGLMAATSIANTELSQGIPKIPLYGIKTFIPVVAVLILLQGVSGFFRKDK